MQQKTLKIQGTYQLSAVFRYAQYSSITKYNDYYQDDLKKASKLCYNSVITGTCHRIKRNSARQTLSIPTSKPIYSKGLPKEAFIITASLMN